ncbi:MAG: SseB family protein [Crocinitomicaceae bacterium]|nr:SseB family protein [Crocinitomicaceae bacterium]
MLGLFKKKKNDTDFPSNDFEHSILDAATNSRTYDQFYTKLLWADLIVLTDGSTPKEEGENATVNFIALESGHIPIFSSINRIHDKGIIKKEVPFITLKGHDLLEITKGASLVLNPYSDYPKELVPEEINDLLEGTIYGKLEEMNKGLSVQELNELDELFKQAFKRLNKLIYLDGFRPRSLDLVNEKKLRQSIAEFEQILEKVPDHWQSIFGMAKAYQRIGEHSKSLELLESALELEKTDHSIALEASIEAVNLRNLEKALLYSEEAIKRSPNNHVLLGNYAMNLLVAGRETEAKETIEKAFILNDSDQINANISRMINDVINGKKKRPTFDDLLNY